MIKGKNILVIAAHNDDEVLGCGGTIAKLSEFNDIHVLILTESTSSQYSENIERIKVEKKEHSDKVRKLLGIKKYFFADLPDMGLESVKSTKLNDIIFEHLIQTKSTVVFTHHNGDINKDHRLIYDSTLVACRPIPDRHYVEKLYCYEVLSSTEWAFNEINSFIPNLWVDISNYIKLKEEAIAVYETEIRSFPHPRSKEGIRILSQKRGLEVGLEFAECFHQIRHTMF